MGRLSSHVPSPCNGNSCACRYLRHSATTSGQCSQLHYSVQADPAIIAQEGASLAALKLLDGISALQLMMGALVHAVRESLAGGKRQLKLAEARTLAYIIGNIDELSALTVAAVQIHVLGTKFVMAIGGINDAFCTEPLQGGDRLD
ncbi:hypothetical protein DTO166G4_790 [Paecilomyces variotii]|nr:hypothetical protein DTO166G4_790 [Paecilomyces variotii]KAJ9242902.1 hypothetical protein DTO166G5_6 [Paecilomyces variotii]KAJ9390962.1 hypothetical protein DTO063F5_1406 [Paecilomyces variotii]